MRPFEILIFITLLLLLITLFFVRKGPRWFFYAPGFPLLMVICHVIFEGVRWQMIPAYAFTAILFLIALKKVFTDKIERIKDLSPGKKILRLSAAFLTFLLLILTLIPPLALPVFKLPQPSGPLSVGSAMLYFIDTTRLDFYSLEKNKYRELSVRVWYPALPDNHKKRLPYMQADEARYMAIHLKAPAYFLIHFKLIQTDSYLNAKPLQGHFPIIFYSPSGSMVDNTALFQELASNGYIVFSVGHPYWNAFYYDDQGQVIPFDGDNVHYKAIWEEENSSLVIKIKDEITSATDIQYKKEAQQKLNKYMPEEVADIRLWSEDLSFLLNQLKDQALNRGTFFDYIDSANVGAIGFSKGGAAAGQFCVSDVRCKAGINLSGFMFGDAVEKSFTRPFMIMESIEPWCTNCNPICDLFYENSISTAYMVRIKEARHANFTDWSLMGGLMKLDGSLGPINGERFLQIQNEYVLAFFNQHLKGESSDLLDRSIQHYQEVIFKSKNTGLSPGMLK
jgi:hypothetical protein